MKDAEISSTRGRAVTGLAGFRSHYLELGELTVHALIGGTGPAVVLLHGFAQTSRAWREIMPTLSERYTVIAPDLRGVGGTDAPSTGFDKRTMARDLAQLLEVLDIPHASIVGHDIGGMVAYAFAKSYPDRVKKLVIAAV